MWAFVSGEARETMVRALGSKICSTARASSGGMRRALKLARCESLPHVVDQAIRALVSHGQEFPFQGTRRGPLRASPQVSLPAACR